MGLFKNLFACICKTDDTQQNTDDIIEMKLQMKKIDRDVGLLFTETKRLDDKISTNFTILSTKIDNIVMILNTKQ